MKKLCCFLLSLGVLLGMTACQSPDDLQLDIYKGANAELKLLHLNASNSTRKQIISGITQALTQAQPTGKPMEFFGFYPDYTISVTTPGDPNQRVTVVLDINGEWVEFYYPGPNPAQDGIIYRSEMSAVDFLKLIHTQMNIS